MSGIFRKYNRCGAWSIAAFAAGSLAFLVSCVPGEAQIEINRQVIPGSTPPIWVSMSGFTGLAAQVIEFDLYVQGFGFTNAENAQYLISGSNTGDLQGRAVDRVNKSPLVSKVYTGATPRRQAHAFTDDFVQALGQKGIAQTKIAFNVGGANSEIYVADFDGANPQAVTMDKTLVAAPCWAPGRLALFYSSYKLGNPAIFFHDLSTGTRKTIAWYGGSNLSPAVSPDGKRVAMILSKDGWTDLYVGDAGGGNVKRLTKSREDESSPCWSPDGQWICFAAKINERRAICKIAATGGSPQRIPTPGFSNPTEPDWSPDGKWIAFTSQGGGFQICVVPSQGGQVTGLVAGEDPSWSRNSRTLVFFRRSTGHLSLLDVPTKQVKDVARVSSGENSQPSWAR
ncbi:MAG TPA: LpqB family beta-propeller domain-containing protein [Verrucomicrobiae bacterium]|nr:LpqB family beta-propeller domain-containing protein [Verrucomicrobiae bacterium]